MSYASNAARYRDVTILSASPEQLVVLLYEHLLVALRRARLAASTTHMEEQRKHLERASNIVAELLATLDMDRGGNVAVNLRSLYVFMLQQFIDVGETADVARLDRLAGMASELHSAFAQAAELVATNKTQR